MNETSAELIRREGKAGETARDMADVIIKEPATINFAVKFGSARRLYETAAECFIIAGRWRDAARAYAAAGKAEKTLGKELIAATFFVDAGDCAERVDTELATFCYVNAVAGYVVNGRFPAAAAVQRRIAALHVESGAHFEAGRAFCYAAELFSGGDDPLQATLHMYEGGQHYVHARKFAEACTAFERAAGIAEDTNLLRAKKPLLLLDALLSLLATGDVAMSEDFLRRHSSTDPFFRSSREYRFANDIIGCTRVLAIHKFMDHAWNFDYAVELAPHQLR